jgi:hypothetical protein
MKWILISAIIVFILWKMPWILITGCILLAIVWGLRHLSRENGENTAEEDGKPYKPFAGWVEKHMKPGFEDDPKWKAASERIKAHVEGKRKTAEQEMIDELEVELKKYKRILKQNGLI